MPELPEVETIRRGLEKYVVGHAIDSVEVRKPKIFQGKVEDIIGAKVVEVERFGKGLVIKLSNGKSLAIHIKLTGQLIFRDQELGIRNQTGREEVPNKFTHVVFHLDEKPSRAKSRDNFSHKGATLYYNDIRQFGWIKVIKSEDLKELSFFKELGPEIPLVAGPTKLTEKDFIKILSKYKTAVKPLIMDQTKMAGIGNIYANDSLYLAKIDPRRPANNLSTEEATTLFKSILNVLKKGLQEGGASELTFVNVLGEKGNYQNHSLVYGKAGQICSRDGNKIQKITLGGRGTFFCPVCQC